mgnify:FL=1
MKAVIFFAHGARDIRWREPFDRLICLWKTQQPQILVRLAFLEMMEPSLIAAIADLKIHEVDDITIVPVFFGQGGHLRNDYPVLLQECRSQFPEINLKTTPAVGESDGVLQAIIDFAVQA